MTRSLRAILARLENRMPIHKGLATWQREELKEIWLDFKRLALPLR